MISMNPKNLILIGLTGALLLVLCACGCITSGNTTTAEEPTMPPFIPGARDKPYFIYPDDKEGHTIAIRINEPNCTGFSEIRHEQGEYGMPIFVLTPGTDAILELRLDTLNSSAVVIFDEISGLPEGVTVTADPESFTGDYGIVHLHLKADDTYIPPAELSSVLWMRSGEWLTGKAIGFA